MIRSELVQKLCEDHPDLTVREIERVATAFFDSIIDQLQKGGRVELRGFGAFSTRDRDARKGRNPRRKAARRWPGRGTECGESPSPRPITHRGEELQR